MKLWRNVSRAVGENWLGAALVGGLFIVVVVYFSVSSQLRAPDIEFTQATPTTDGYHSGETEMVSATPQQVHDSPPEPPEPVLTEAEKQRLRNPVDLSFEDEPDVPAPPLKPICDRSDWRFDACDMSGDARVAGKSKHSMVYFVPSPSQIATAEYGNWSIRSQSRKMVPVTEVIVQSLNASMEAPNCTVRHSVPALVFSSGGLIYNFWHAMSDVFVPLFITAREFDGEIQLLLVDYQRWFYLKYETILKAFSKFDIIDLDRDNEVRCYPRVLVSLHGHGDLAIDPKRAPNHYDMYQFRLFIRAAYDLAPFWTDIPYKVDGSSEKKPRLMIILREGSRKFVNEDEVVTTVEAAGFEVVKFEPKFMVNLTEYSKLVDSCDALMGVHGAGLTNMIFLRTNALLIQVIPYGNMEIAAEIFFGSAAREMKLRLLNHNVTAEESSYYEKYGKDDPVISDPEAVHRNGSADLYWRQDVILNVSRFAPVLQEAIEMIRQ